MSNVSVPDPKGDYIRQDIANNDLIPPVLWTSLNDLFEAWNAINRQYFVIGPRRMHRAKEIRQRFQAAVRP